MIVKTLSAALALLLSATLLHAADTAGVPLADGFDLPVGHNGAQGYHKVRGFQENGHLGEDWDGNGGGDTDLGDPVYASGTGLVVLARNVRLGWGNLIIVRHAYYENGSVQYADSVYGHVDQIMVRENQVVKRGQQIGTIGNAFGLYEAHLHFEMRKNLGIGYNHSAGARDFTNYWDPTSFVEAHRTLAAGQIVAVPINTFDQPAQPVFAGPITAPTQTVIPAKPVPRAPTGANNSPRGPFFVDRYSDLRGRGF